MSRMGFDVANVVLNAVQDAEYMEQKKSERESRGNRGWSNQARQQELDEADRFQVLMLCFTLSHCRPMS